MICLRVAFQNQIIQSLTFEPNKNLSRISLSQKAVVFYPTILQKGDNRHMRILIGTGTVLVLAAQDSNGLVLPWRSASADSSLT